MPTAEIIPQNAESPPATIDLRKLCQERLSAYKAPLLSTLVYELPLAASGKLRRY
jgi:acyl-CoA synthetase (AMP-forming)/AMP-acid ligase II